MARMYETLKEFKDGNRIDCKISVVGGGIYLDFSTFVDGRSYIYTAQIRNEDLKSCTSFRELMEKLYYKEGIAVWEMFSQYRQRLLN